MPIVADDSSPGPRHGDQSQPHEGIVLPRELIHTLVESLRTLTTGLEEMLRHFEYVEARDSARHNSVMSLVQRMLPHLSLEDDDDAD